MRLTGLISPLFNTNLLNINIITKYIFIIFTYMKTIKATRGFTDLDKNVPRKKGDQWEVSNDRADFLINEKKWAVEVQVKEEKQVRKTKEDKTELKTK